MISLNQHVSILNQYTMLKFLWLCVQIDNMEFFKCRTEKEMTGVDLMKKPSELTILSELNKVSIKNYSNELELTLLPVLKELLEIADDHQPPNTIASAVVGRASLIEETAAVISVSQSKTGIKTPSRTLSVKENPVVIEIKNPLDEATMVNLLRLVGEHTPSTMSEQDMQTLVNFVAQNEEFDKLKFERTEIRIKCQIPKETFQPLFHLPPVFNQFTGREQELTQLKAHRELVQVIMRQEAAKQIAGTGGIGKSQLVNYFARSQFREKYYNWVIWLTGGVDDNSTINSLQSQLTQLGQSLCIDVKENKDRDLYRLIYLRLAAKGHGLVILDDVPNYAVARPYLPECHEQPQLDVLITTRNNLTFGNSVKKIILDVFNIDDAINYILRMLNNTVSKTDAELLATTLNRYPLALSQALAFIINSDCTIETFCKRYRASKKAQKAYVNEPVLQDDSYEMERQDQRKWDLQATIATVVEISLDQVRILCKSKEACDRTYKVLLATAYLAPETAIPRDLLKGWIPNDEVDSKIGDAVKALRALSFLEEGDINASYRIHQIIQEVLKLQESPDSIRKQLLQWVVFFKNYLEENSFQIEIKEKKYTTLRPHVLAVAQQLNLLHPRSEELFDAEAAMYRIAGLACKVEAKDKLAKSHFDSELKCLQQMSTNVKNKVRQGICLVDLGDAMRCCGESKGAKERLTKALEILKSSLTEPHVEIGKCLMHLGIAHVICGDSEGGKERLTESLKILRSTLKEPHEEIGRCLVKLGWATLSCGDVDGAEKHYVEALRILKSTLGKTHVDVGRCLTNFGSAMQQRGNFQRAIELHTKALKILEDNLGKQHVDVAGCLSNLGVVTLDSGDPYHAEEYFKKGEPILKSAKGERHVDVGRCLSNQGLVAIECGRLDDAKNLLDKALEIFKVALADQKNQHADEGRCLMYIGRATMLCDDPQSAKDLLNKALPILRASLGKEHVEVGRCLMNLGGATLLCNDPRDAVKLLEEATPILKNKLRENHTDVMKCQLILKEAGDKFRRSNLNSLKACCDNPFAYTPQLMLFAAVILYETEIISEYGAILLCGSGIVTRTISPRRVTESMMRFFCSFAQQELEAGRINLDELSEQEDTQCEKPK